MGHTRLLLRLLPILWLALALPGLATPAWAGQAGDLVFAERGPWDLSQGPLVWRLHHDGPRVEGFRPLGEGVVTMAATTDPADGKPMLELVETVAGVDRRLGRFPASDGDPVLTFFLESTTRDMAALTGGSPFYIRNRLKEALFGGGSVLEEGGSRIALFIPFAKDKNRERMYGFDTLELRFTLDEPGKPIRQLQARTGPLAGGLPAYRNDMVLQ